MLVAQRIHRPDSISDLGNGETSQASSKQLEFQFQFGAIQGIASMKCRVSDRLGSRKE